MPSPSRPQPKCLSRVCAIVSSRLFYPRGIEPRPGVFAHLDDKALSLQPLELRKRRVRGARALIPRLPHGIELPADENHDLLPAGRTAAPQPVAKATHVAV